jgi:hypothetical protein
MYPEVSYTTRFRRGVVAIIPKRDATERFMMRRRRPLVALQVIFVGTVLRESPVNKPCGRESRPRLI